MGLVCRRLAMARQTACRSSRPQWMFRDKVWGKTSLPREALSRQSLPRRTRRSALRGAIGFECNEALARRSSDHLPLTAKVNLRSAIPALPLETDARLAHFQPEPWQGLFSHHLLKERCQGNG